MDELTDFLRTQPTAVVRLLTSHIDDGRGHCQICRLGAQQGSHPWPCTIQRAADRAQRANRQRLGSGP